MNEKKFEFHYGYNDCNGTRIEWFTNLPPKQYQKHYLTLRTGCFRVTRKDNERGHRYFINDLRDVNTEPNSVVLFNQEDFDLIKEYQVTPAYIRDDINVYYLAQYEHPDKLSTLTLTPTGLEVNHLNK